MIAYINTFINITARICEDKKKKNQSLWARYTIGFYMFTSCKCIFGLRALE